MHSTAHKHASQYVVDAGQRGRAVQYVVDAAMRSTLMMMDTNGPDIQAVDEVKALILESVNTWKNYEKWVPSKGSQGTRAPRSAHATRNVNSQLSGLEDVVFNDFIKVDFIPQGDGQVASGSASLPDPVALETEEQTLEREENERDVLEALGEYKCDAGMSVENVPAVVKIQTLKGRLIAHKCSTGWAVGVMKSGKEKECCWPICSQV